MPFEVWIWLAAMGAVAAHAFDMYTTVSALRLGGREMNPVVRWALPRIRVEGVTAFKCGLMPITLIALAWPLAPIHFVWPNLVYGALGLAAGLWNQRQIRKVTRG